MNRKIFLALLLIIGIGFSQTYPLIIANPNTLECEMLRNPEQRPDGFMIVGSVTSYGTIKNGCNQWLCDQTNGTWTKTCNCPEDMVFTETGCTDIDEEQLCKQTRGIWASGRCSCTEGIWSNQGCIYENGEPVPEFNQNSIVIPIWIGLIFLIVVFVFRKKLLTVVKK